MPNPCGVLEVKCPASAKDKSLRELCIKPNFFLSLQANNTMKLKANHSYHYQVQGQMHITQRMWCDFFVWTPRVADYHIERIFYKPELWENIMYPKLRKFYFCSMLPELASPRYPSCQRVRDTLKEEL